MSERISVFLTRSVSQKPFDLIGILADCCNCSYVLGRALIWHPIRSSKSFFAYFLNHPII
ncbi:hypothetical protein FFZ96_15535 [Leptospira borgpetersenii]|nr:hypothetical protein FFZ96_15535 [Leptospira borgpetersenii]